MTRPILLLSILLSLIVPHGAQAISRETRLECPMIRPIAGAFLQSHYEAKKLDLEHEGRSIERYIKLLDPSKIYLQQSDVAEIKGLLRGSFKNLGEDCTNIEKAHSILVKRLAEAAETAKKTLGPDFKFVENTEVVNDPDLRKYPASQKEAEEQLKTFIQFQISNYLASDTKLADAKKQLIHRYELTAKRQAESKKEEIYGTYLEAFATALDAHSSYLPDDALQDFEISMSLSLEGIGAALIWDDGYTTVESLIPGGSAERSGELQPKDKIIAVAQGKAPAEQVIDMPLRDVVKLIRGKKGTTVRLTILRQTPKETVHRTVTLVRDKIKLEDEAARLSMTTKKVGDKSYKVAVINLPSFYGDLTKHTRSCYDDMKKRVEEAVKAKADGIVLDLSKNGGGLLTEAVKIAGLFIKRGNIVRTMDSRERSDTLADEDTSIGFSGPMIILTSRLSASASEIVAGALQDYKRALIVGADHTFGKGTVQAMTPLPPNLGAIKVTTGMFFVAGGESTQFRGVPGDVVLPSPFSVKEIGEEKLDFPLKHRSVPPFVSADANEDGPGHWKPLDDDLIKKLKTLSAARVEKDPEFKKIKDELAEQEKKKGIIKLADSLKKQKEEKADPKNKAKLGRRNKRQTDEEYMKDPQISEAVSIMADMIHLSSPSATVAHD